LRIAAALFVSFLGASSATAAPWHHATRGDPLDLRNIPPPATDADMDRMARQKSALHLHTLVDDVVDQLGVQDGKADIFNDSLANSGAGSLSGTIDARGARLRLRW
jgi:hypothetical protein